MLGKKMEKALNEQVNAEMYSSYLYLSMEAYFQSLSLKGFANWMRCQAQEEMFHAIKMYDHIIERGGKVTLTAIEGPATAWESPLAVFEDALELLLLGFQFRRRDGLRGDGRGVELGIGR